VFTKPWITYQKRRKRMRKKKHKKMLKRTRFQRRRR